MRKDPRARVPGDLLCSADRIATDRIVPVASNRGKMRKIGFETHRRSGSRGRLAPGVWPLVLFLLFQAIAPGLHPETKPRSSCAGSACEANLLASSTVPAGCAAGAAGLKADSQAGSDAPRHDPHTCGLCRQILHPPIASLAPAVVLSITAEPTLAPRRPARAAIPVPIASEFAPRAPPCA